MTKKPPKKPAPKQPPAPPPLTDEEIDLLDSSHAAISDAVDLMSTLLEKKGRLPNRAFSVALTYLETAEMWMDRGFEEAGLVQDEDEDEDDEGADEPSENADEHTES